jgi:hypothetical protein
MLVSRDSVKFIPTIPASAQASVVLTSNNTNVSDGDTVTIGAQVYQFKNTPAAAFDVQIGTSADATLVSLAKAINGDGVVGTDYFAGTTKNSQVSATETVTSHTITITAIVAGAAGNQIASTKSAATLTFASATLLGGIGGQTLGMVTSTLTAVTTDPIHVGEYFEGMAFLNVSAHAGTLPTFDCKVQYSPDKTNWMDSGDAFTQVTTTNSLTNKKLTANFGIWVRFVLTIAGTAPVYTFDLSLVCKS